MIASIATPPSPLPPSSAISTLDRPRPWGGLAICDELLRPRVSCQHFLFKILVARYPYIGVHGQSIHGACIAAAPLFVVVANFQASKHLRFLHLCSLQLLNELHSNFCRHTRAIVTHHHLKFTRLPMPECTSITAISSCTHAVSTFPAAQLAADHPSSPLMLFCAIRSCVLPVAVRTSVGTALCHSPLS